MRWKDLTTILATKKNRHFRRKMARMTRQRTTGRRLVFESLECKAMLSAAPVAMDDGGAEFTTDEDTEFTTGDVLANDTGVALSVASVDSTGTLGIVINNDDGTFDYDPNGQFEHLTLGETATDTFTYTVSDGHGGTDTATVSVTVMGKIAKPDAYTVDEGEPLTVLAPGVLSNDEGDTLTVIKVNDQSVEPFIPGTVELDSGATVVLRSNGNLTYDDGGLLEWLAAGQTYVDTFTYTISDGNGNEDTATVSVTIIGKNATLSGLVYVDVNNDGEVDITDQVVENVTIELLDHNGSVVETTYTDADGVYLFEAVAEGTYTIREIQPSGFVDGIDTAGTLGGDAVTVNDQISGIVVEQTDGENYNFGEQGQAIEGGDTATIGFWQNKNGQKLIKTVSSGTRLGDWLAEEFPNMFGDLLGSSNEDVAEEYQRLFKVKHQKLDAQVMATALSVFVTSSGLSYGMVAADYGFTVTASGIGTKLFNVGDSGEAFDVADNCYVTIMDLLKATDDKTASGGELYDLDDDGIDMNEQLLRNLANEVFTAINEQGDI